MASLTAATIGDKTGCSPRSRSTSPSSLSTRGPDEDTLDEDSPLIEGEPKALGKAARPQAKATASQLTLNLIIGGLGTGIFTLPWSTAGASVVPALLIIALVLLLNAWTISILVQAADRHQTFDLGGLLARLPGRLGDAGQAACNIGVWFSLFLCLIGYTITAADCAFMTLLPEATATAPHAWMLRCGFVILASLFVLPLCFLDQGLLSYSSFVGVAVFVSIFGCILETMVIEQEHGARPPACYMGVSSGSIAMVSAMMQSIIVQMCVLPMYEELENRTPERFNKIVATSFSSLFFIFSGFAVFGYLAFGEDVKSNVLLSLPHTTWGSMSRLLAAVGVLVVYPIMINPMIAPVRNMRHSATGLDPQRLAKIVTCGVVAAATVCGFFVTDLGFLNVVNGAMSLGVFVALIPGLVGLYLLGDKSDVLSWRGLMYALIAVGVCFSILGLIYTDNYAQVLRGACEWKSS